METLPCELVLNVLSFDCAYEYSLLSRACRRFVVEHAQAPVVNRDDDTSFYDLEDDVPYIDVDAVYAGGRLARASSIVRTTFEEMGGFEFELWFGSGDDAETFIEHGICSMWDKENGGLEDRRTVRDFVSHAMREIDDERAREGEDFVL